MIKKTWPWWGPDWPFRCLDVSACSVGRKTYCTKYTFCIVRTMLCLHCCSLDKDNSETFWHWHWYFMTISTLQIMKMMKVTQHNSQFLCFLFNRSLKFVHVLVKPFNTSGGCKPEKTGGSEGAYFAVAEMARMTWHIFVQLFPPSCASLHHWLHLWLHHFSIQLLQPLPRNQTEKYNGLFILWLIFCGFRQCLRYFGQNLQDGDDLWEIFQKKYGNFSWNLPFRICY